MNANRRRTILVGEDELEVRGYLQMALQYLGYSVELAQDGDEVLSYLRFCQGEIDAVVLDTTMPHREGRDTLREIRGFMPDLPVIMLSGPASSSHIINAMQDGATDFLCKPVVHDDLLEALDRALERNSVSDVPASRVSAPHDEAFLGNSPRMREIQSLIGHIGWSEAPVLIQGETGSGKEVLARELHAHSPRSAKPFLKLNCAAPLELVEGELFGYERGTFTGAFQKEARVFENANGGTLLLDEIGDMDIRPQAKLLQVLQDRSFQRIGSKEVVKVDVRVMATTHQDLEKAMDDGTFREDLYYRLHVIKIQLPPLRERKEDVLPLTEFLMKKHAQKGAIVPPLTNDLKQALINYHWPGNVRELENYLRKLLIFRDCDSIVRDLNAKATRPPLAVKLSAEPQPNIPKSTVEESPILEQVVKAKQQAETVAILRALNSTHWNLKRAATVLKIDYKALLYKIKKLGIKAKPVSTESSTPTHR